MKCDCEGGNAELYHEYSYPGGAIEYYICLECGCDYWVEIDLSHANGRCVLVPVVDEKRLEVFAEFINDMEARE